MTKEHKKLYKAGKNWIVATLTATTITLLGGIGAYTVHADTTIESSQDVQTTSVNQTNQVDNSNNSVILNNNQPVAVQSSQTAQNDQSVQGNQTNQTVPSSATAASDTSNSDGLDSNIYGTANVKDWYYQDSNNIINLTGYHGPDTQHIVVPNLNDFSKAGIKVGDRIGVGIDAETLNNMNTSYNNKNMKTLAISKTEGKFSDKVIALGSNWRYGFSNGKITNLDVSNLDTSNITDMDQMFLNASSLQKITGLEKWNTSNVKDMSSMFYGVSSLKKLTGIENWDTGNVVNMNGMFEYDSSLQSLNLEKWNVKNVKNFGYMFSNTSALMNIYGIENWNTKSATNLTCMFYNATGLNKINLSNWNISKVVDVSYMFYEASNLKIIEGLENWNTENIEYMESMFYGDSNLNSIGDISKWKTGNVKDMSRMFWGTKLLTNIGNLSNWRTQNVQRMNGIFVNSGLHLIFYVANSDKKYDNKVNLIDESGNTIATIQSPTFYYQNTQSEPITVKQTVTQLILNKINELSNKHLNKVYTNLRMDNAFDSENTTDMANATYIVDVLQKVKINYIDPTGKLLKTDIVSGKIGDNVKISINLPNGYELANKNEQVPATVPVTENGIQTVIVNVKKIPVTVSGHINYIDPDGKVVKTDQVSGKVGDKVDVKLSLPDGYELANKDEQVPSTITVGDDGIKTININIKKIPVIKTGTINYIDPDGKVVKTDQVSGKVGDKVDVKLSLPDGYELANKDEHIPSVITVTENGIGTINVNVKKINTTLANNEVPYDSTTISNNVNANYGYLDSYKLTENNQGQAQLIASGWHATGASNSDRYRYMIVFDNTLGHEIARQKLVPQVRSDVQRAYPNVDNSLYSGFNITIDIPNSSINHSLSLIARYSNDPNNGEGARVDYWFNPLALNEGNQAYLDGLSSNGNTLTVTGWHATNQAAGRPYHYIIAWDQNLGHEIARQKVTAVSRPDVANAYSTVANAVNSGFSVKFNLTPQFFNDNIQFISRWTDDAAGNGNAVDYWFKPMNRTNRANLDSVTLSNGQVKVAGWHATDLSQLEPNHYLIVFDNTTGQQVASEKVGLQSSQDVKNVFGDVQTANHSRFNYAFKSLHLISGHNYSLVSRYSADANGNGNDGAHTDSWLNMGTFQQSAYSIDHVALNRRHMTVQGWVANDNAMTRPYAYAILLQNGHEIGRQRLNLSERADVAKVYPQIYRSQYSGFNTSFDLPTASTNGLQLVLRFTDDPAGNGNSSDKWINL